jgi:hypothetical protein
MDDRLKVLSKFADAQSEVYGIKSPKIETFAKGREETINTQGRKGIKLGSFGNGTIRVNTHPDAAFHDFDRLINLVAHESGHNYQRNLIERLASEGSDKLLPSDV